MSASRWDDTRKGIRGLVLNQPTPYQAGSLAVDHDGLRRNIEHWMAHKVPVIMITAGTSDFASMSYDEICAVTKTTVEAVRGRAHVMACTGLWWLGQTLEFARFAEQIGADSLMVVKHEPATMTPQHAYDFHKALADKTGIPLVYHSHLVGPKSIEVLKRVLEIPSVIAMKQETDTYPQYSLLRDHFSGRMAVICGAGGELAFHAHQFGAVGSLTGTGQWAPGPEVQFVEQMLVGDFVGAKHHLERILPIRRTTAMTQYNAAAIKYAMDLAGLSGGPSRPMLWPEIPAAAKAELEAAIHASGLLKKS